MRLKGSGDDGIRAVLFRYLDNRARGGLDYTIRLVEDSKLADRGGHRLAGRGAGEIRERAEAVRERFNLRSKIWHGFQDRWMRGPDRAAAEKYLVHLRDETAFYVKLLLRRPSLHRGHDLLRDMSEYLGTQRGTDTRVASIWDGALAELLKGRDLVEHVLHDFDAEVRLLQDAVSRQNAGTYVVLDDSRFRG